MANEENRQFTPEQEKEAELKAVWAELIRLRAEVETYKKINETKISERISQSTSNFLSLLELAKTQGVKEAAALAYDFKRPSKFEYTDLTKETFTNLLLAMWEKKNNKS